MDTMIGVDLAKSVFQLHGAAMTGEVLFRKKLTRSQFLKFMSDHAPAVVVMEACGGAHYWARVMAELGHQVQLIAPQYVRPFVKRQKNDAADAEAIVVAAQRPEMRFVEPKTEEQQARAAIFRSRDRLVRQRTELINALRGVLYEHGHVFPTGAAHVGRIEALLRDPDNGLHPLVLADCLDLLDQISEKSGRIEARTRTTTALSAQASVTRRLQTIPGVGPLTALAVETFAPPMETFSQVELLRPGLELCRGSIPRAANSGLEKSRKRGRGT